ITTLTEGWTTDSLSCRLVWVPAWLRAHFCGPPASLVIAPNGTTTLDLTKFVHGVDWVKCPPWACAYFDGPATVSSGRGTKPKTPWNGSARHREAIAAGWLMRY
ncbi:hypothetical protein C8F04DRAFT_1151443, partial [Mycena alexandri]